LEVIFDEKAFIPMVTAAVETYPNETIGVLLGFRARGRIMVQYAVAYQTAKRKRDSVEVHPRISRRMDGFLGKVTHLEVVGDFHWHPENPVDKISSVRLSDPDKKSMMVNNLGIVIAIDKDGVERPWEHLPKGSLKGSIFPYSLKIVSYWKPELKVYKVTKIDRLTENHDLP
jgi:proteasome lid subunit RPN8/RPN11